MTNNHRIHKKIKSARGLVFLFLLFFRKEEACTLRGTSLLLAIRSSSQKYTIDRNEVDLYLNAPVIIYYYYFLSKKKYTLFFNITQNVSTFGHTRFNNTYCIYYCALISRTKLKQERNSCGIAVWY